MYKYDLHVHSSPASACGRNSAIEMVNYYKEFGFSGFALTNHFWHGNTGVSRSLSWENFVKEYAKDYYNALETAYKLDFDLFFGIEEGYGNGKEFLVYGLTPEILTENPCLQTNDIEIWSKTVHENGGFITYAHPFRNRDYITDPYKMPDISLVDGLECYNFCNTDDDNERAISTFKDSGKIITAGGDLHWVSFKDTYGIMTNKRIKSGKELVTSLKTNSFELYLGK